MIKLWNLSHFISLFWTFPWKLAANKEAKFFPSYKSKLVFFVATGTSFRLMWRVFICFFLPSSRFKWICHGPEQLVPAVSRRKPSRSAETPNGATPSYTDF